MAKLVLFDIDGTLVLTGGAGVRAMNRAFKDLLGVGDAFVNVPMAGRTDLAILTEVVARATPAFALDEDWIARFRDRYVALLREELQVDAPGKCVLPGVADAIAALASRDDVHVALLTGNFRDGAEAKLGYFSLWDAFPFGAFGDEAVDRNLLLPVALDHAETRGLGPFAPRDVFVDRRHPVRRGVRVERRRGGGGRHHRAVRARRPAPGRRARGAGRPDGHRRAAAALG